MKALCCGMFSLATFLLVRNGRKVVIQLINTVDVELEEDSSWTRCLLLKLCPLSLVLL